MSKKSTIIIKDWDELRDDFDRMNSMSCKPNFQKMKTGTIIDENMSVRWNRVQVEENNSRYDYEVACLNTKKNKARDALYEDIYRKIQSETGASLDAAKMIFDYAYDRGHSGGFYAIQSELNELIELTQVILKGIKK